MTQPIFSRTVNATCTLAAGTTYRRLHPWSLISEPEVPGGPPGTLRVGFAGIPKQGGGVVKSVSGAAEDDELIRHEKNAHIIGRTREVMA
jgi:hypothetical protein